MIGIDKTLFASASSKLNSMFLVSANQRLQTLVALLMFIESVQSDLTCYAGSNATGTSIVKLGVDEASVLFGCVYLIKFFAHYDLNCFMYSRS